MGSPDDAGRACEHRSYTRMETHEGPVDVCDACCWERDVLRIPTDSGPSPRTRETRGDWHPRRKLS